MQKKYRNDLILIGIFVVIACLLLVFYFISRKESVEVVIYHNEDIVLKKSIEDDGIYTVKGDISDVVIEIKDKRVRVIDSKCYDYTCMNTGFIEYENEVITCLPNKIFVRLE